MKKVCASDGLFSDYSSTFTLSSLSTVYILYVFRVL